MMRVPVTNHLDVFDTVFDVVVVGSGYAGLSAAMACASAGRQTLLVGPRGDLVWESGRAFHPAVGHSEQPVWRDFLNDLHRRQATTDDLSADTLHLDGAAAEALATSWLIQRAIHVLYYAQPVAVTLERNAVASLTLATKAGLRRVIGRQWIDATETGELVRLALPTATPRKPDRLAIHLHLQHPDWDSVAGAPAMGRTRWATERLLTHTWAADALPGAPWRQRIVPVLDQLRDDLGSQALGQTTLSHLSIEPMPLYDQPGIAPLAADALPGNVALATPAFVPGALTTLAQRFDLGCAAATSLAQRTIHEPSPEAMNQPPALPASWRTSQSDVAVAGLGTGGALAALAAAQAGASVIGLEPLAFLGGIGTGGGIHSYYYGIVGGLQEQVDLATRDLMRRHRHEDHAGPLGSGPFNPWAKAIALEALLARHGVAWHTDALVYDVERHAGRVQAAWVATPQGVLRVEAQAWVDGTGDGDLCVMAGAAATLGREGDGLPHAYSQSGGRLREVEGDLRMAVINFDAGFCDPTDPQDLTRARLVAISHYLLDRNEPLTRHTYLAPALGLRQGRQIVTDHMLTLDDLIRSRRFDDAIGFTGGHYDSHSTDYEFESDESRFWVWINRGWSDKFACEMPHRMLLPRGLDNVWIASRCVGVTQDAHYACRMQRDIQRIGEAAGFAAAEAARQRVDSRDLPHASLRKWLDQTGALDANPRPFQKEFGGMAQDAWLDPAQWQKLAHSALDALDAARTGQPIWWLYQHRDITRDAVAQRLAHDDPQVRWLAAGVLAMWQDSAAEPRLIQAIDALEFGHGEQTPELLASYPFKRLVPHWLAAVGLLPLCGSAACLPSLKKLLDNHPVQGINALTTVARTLGRLAQRLDASHAPSIAAMLDRVAATPFIGHLEAPQRFAGRFAQEAIRGDYDDPATHGVNLGGQPADTPHGHAMEDNTWQLHLTLAQARTAWGLEAHAQAKAYLQDPRLLVRRAMAAAMATQSPLATASQ